MSLESISATEDVTRDVKSKVDWRPPQSVALLSFPGKAFTHLFLDRIKPLLLEKRRPQQSGFTSGRAIVDRINALNLIFSD